MTRTAATLVVRNVGQLVTVDEAWWGAPLGVIEGGALVAREGRIAWVGREVDLQGQIPPGEPVETVDAGGGVATPGLVDSHTHLLYAGSREREFALRVRGATLEELTRAGGGIMATVRATRAASDEELMRLGLERLDLALAHGTTTVEAKSGYGLDTPHELRLLECARRLDRIHPVDVVGTLLGAHAVPPEMVGRREEYVRVVAGEMVPAVGEGKLAEFCDVFCDAMAFTPGESERILEAGQRFGLKPKLHAEQFSRSGGSLLAARLRAVSADHLDYASDSDLEALAAARVVGVLTPGVNFFVGLKRWPPARRMLDLGMEVALATDLTPGSCTAVSLPLMMTVACTQLGLSPEEAIRAATLGGARAVAREAEIGSLAVGKRADLALFDAPNYLHLPYQFGVNLVRRVIKDGRLVWDSSGGGLRYA